jgi:hypothetical protein
MKGISFLVLWRDEGGREVCEWDCFYKNRLTYNYLNVIVGNEVA